MFTLFKHACVYTLKRPDVIDMAKLNDLLAAYPFTPCKANDMSRTGWRPITDGSDRFYHSSGRNILLVMQTQKKILPSPVIKENLNTRVDKLELEQSRRLKAAEKTTIKEEVLQCLLPRAFTRNSFTQIWIDIERGHVVVDTSSARTAESALALLRKSLGSLPVTPVMSVNPPATELTDWLKAQRAPSPFHLGDITTAKLESILEVGATTTFKKEPVGSETLESSLSDGRIASSVAVKHEGRFMTDVTLCDDLVFKRIGYSDLFIETNDDVAFEGSEDEVQALARKDADFLLMCDTLGVVIADALAAFGGESKS